MHHLSPGFLRAPASPGVHTGCVHLFQNMSCGKGHVHRQEHCKVEQHRVTAVAVVAVVVVPAQPPPWCIKALRGEIGGCLLLQSWWVLEVSLPPSLASI